MKVATNSQVGGLLAVAVSELPGYPGRQVTCAARTVSLLVEKNQVPPPNRRAFRLVCCLQSRFQTAFFGTWLSLDGYIKMVSKLWMEGSLCEVYRVISYLIHSVYNLAWSPAHAKNEGASGTHCLCMCLISPRCGGYFLILLGYVMSEFRLDIVYLSGYYNGM